MNPKPLWLIYASSESRVYLVHQTAKESLLAIGNLGGSTYDSWRDSLGGRQCQILMARTYLRYLCFADFDGPASATEHLGGTSITDYKNFDYCISLDDETPQFSFMDYAAANWPSHFEEAHVDSADALFTMGAKLYNIASRHYEMWSSRYLRTKITKKDESIPSRLIGHHLAAITSMPTIMGYVLGTGNADINIKDDKGRTPLLWAAKLGHEIVMELILALDSIEADTQDLHGRTPLSYAAEHGLVQAVRMLVGRDAVETDSNDDFGWRMLNTTSREEEVNLIRRMKKFMGRGDIKPESSGRTPLSYAAENGHLETTQVLLARKEVNVNSKNKLERTPLHYAALEGKALVVEQLLKQSEIEADTKDIFINTPLTYSVSNGHEAVARLLLARQDIRLDQEDDDGKTPLLNAVGYRNETMVRLLLQREDVNPYHCEKTSDISPIQLAISLDNVSMIGSFLESVHVEANTR